MPPTAVRESKETKEEGERKRKGAPCPFIEMSMTEFPQNVLACAYATLSLTIPQLRFGQNIPDCGEDCELPRRGGHA